MRRRICAALDCARAASAGQSVPVHCRWFTKPVTRRGGSAYPDIRLKHSHSSSRAVERDNADEGWHKFWRIDRLHKAEDRDQFYSYIREHNVKDERLLDVLSYIPKKDTYFSDYMFAVEMRIILGDVAGAETLLVEIARSHPVYAERILTSAIKLILAKGSQGVPQALNIFCKTLVALGKDPRELHQYNDRPLIQDLLKILQYSPALAFKTVESLGKSNLFLASRIGSAILCVTCLSSEKRIPAIIENIWAWKVERSLATPKDLHCIMFYYIYLKAAETALYIYDRYPKLHRPWQNDAVLLAAAEAHQWKRLQDTFELLADNQFEVSGEQSRNTTSENFSAKHYAIVLQALGNLGGAETLQGIFDGICKRGLPPRPRGIFHAMMHSFALLGDADEVQRYFDIMTQEYGIEPVRVSFTLLLKAYSEAGDLKRALETIGLMTSEYLLPLTNKELTLLLALCARRRDAVTGTELFKWGQKSIKELDVRTYNSYINCLVQKNPALGWEVFKNMPHEPTIQTLTTLLAPYARFGDAAKFAELRALRRKYRLRPDAKWFGTVMMYFSQTKNYDMLSRTFNQMKKRGIKPTGGYFGIMMELQTKERKFEDAENLIAQFQEEQGIPTYSLYEKYFRMLSKASQESLLYGHSMAIRLLQSGFFDIASQDVPKNKAPVDLIKYLVRAHLKHGNIDLAQQLVSEVQKVGTSSHAYRLLALKLEVDVASGDVDAVEAHWPEFLNELHASFIPTKAKAASGFVHRIPRKYRFNYANAVTARIDQLTQRHRYTDLLRLPKSLEDYGLGMSSLNWNQLVRALANCPDTVENANWLTYKAFELAESYLTKNYFARNRARQEHVAGDAASRTNLPTGTSTTDAQGTIGSSTIAALGSHVSRVLNYVETRDQTTHKSAMQTIHSEFRRTMAILRQRMAPVLQQLHTNAGQ